MLLLPRKYNTYASKAIRLHEAYQAVTASLYFSLNHKSQVWESMSKYEKVWSGIFWYRIFAASSKEDDTPVLKGRKDTNHKKIKSYTW